MWWIEIVKEHEKTSSYRASFEVKKYVLPKFEVLLNHKKALSPKDKNITVVVCAKYIFCTYFNYIILIILVLMKICTWK
jgi:hypothetical protein